MFGVILQGVDGTQQMNAGAAVTPAATSPTWTAAFYLFSL
jgi:hypothetical protein